MSIHCIDSPITDVVRILNYKLRNEHGDMFTINLQGEKRWTGWTYELIDGTDPFVGGVDDERWVKLPLQPPVVSIDVENAPIIEVLEAIEKQHASIRVVYLETEVNIILLPPKQGIVPVRGELGSGGEGP